MAQEEHTSRCSNSSGGGGGGGGGESGGGRCSKKLKHKKVPQRGMGVAQLEKIISEEQQKKDVAILTPNSIVNPSNTCLGSNFRPPMPVSSTSIPLPPPLLPNHRPLVSKTDPIGGGKWGRVQSDAEYNSQVENENQNQNRSNGLDHHGFAKALPYESNPPIWAAPIPNVMQRAQPCSSSMVNVSIGVTSSTSSLSVMNFQIEPPSNQSYYGNNHPPLWQEEEKIVGMKRSYPFSMENVPIPSFHCKFPSAYVSPILRSDESASCSNGVIASLGSPNPVFRENPSNSGSITDTITKKFIDETRGLTRDFLKLAPPQASHSNSGSKDKLHLSPIVGEPPQFEILAPLQGQTKDSILLSGRGGSKSNQLPFISFFPAAKTPMGQAGNSNGEAGESVDLNLKL